MPVYTVTLDFAINFGACDVTPGQTPPGIPEEMAGDKLSVECTSEHGSTRSYGIQQVVEAENSDGLEAALKSLFEHLPEFYVVASSIQTAHSGQAPPEQPACGVHAIVCRFQSDVPFFRLSQQLASQVAVGSLLNHPASVNQYVAVVFIGAPTNRGLGETVEGLLIKAFEAETEESAINFKSIKTVVL